MARDLGIELKGRIYTDSSAAKGIASRRGLGKTRHIAAHNFSVQEKVRHGDVDLH